MGAIQVASEAAEAMRPLAGEYAYILFAFGLFNASSSRPRFSAFDGLHGLRGLGSSPRGQKFKEAPFFYWLYTLLIGGALTVLLLPMRN